MNIIGIIPARGGSKGLPGKNIKELLGKPMIAYTIEEGRKSRFIDKLIVSTDDLKIAHISKNYGAEIPFMRPSMLSQDNSKAIDVYTYTLNRIINEQNYKADIVIILQPTSPLRTAKHIDEAVQMFIEKRADSVVSVCEVEHSPYWNKVIDNEGRLSNFITSNDYNANRQELPSIYRPNGAVYVFKSDLLLEFNTYYTQQSYGYIMKNEDSIDIDTMFDFKMAELIMSERIK